MQYATPGAFRHALEARLRAESERSGLDVVRLRRRTVFIRILARLEASTPGRWVLKGAMALEARFGDRARATRDLDLALRNAPETEGIREFLAAALSSDPDGDFFEFLVLGPTGLAPDEAGRPGWRFPIEASLGGRLFARVQVDVVARRSEVSETERLRLPGLDFAGIPGPMVEVVDRKQHFAEKLHALTRTYAGHRPSTRVRDLPDMIALIEDGLDPSHELLRTTERLFALRATHDLPTDIVDPPAEWGAQYESLAEPLEVGAKTIDQALAVLRPFWAETLGHRDNGGPPHAAS